MIEVGLLPYSTLCFWDWGKKITMIDLSKDYVMHDPTISCSAIH